MVGNYNILRGGEIIGRAQVKREGLYYRFRCACELTGAVIYRLIVTCGNQTENLGILVPDGKGFCLDKRIPVSRFSGSEPLIWAVPGHGTRTGIFAPVKPDEPFRYLAQLESARLERRDGEIGVILKNQVLPLSSSSK